MSVGPEPLHVLLVDDHPLVRTGIRVALGQHFTHLQVDEAGCATEALAAIADRRPHLVLLDVNLPGTNGLDLARQILATDKTLRVLMVASDMDPWTVNEALETGASGFVAKTSSGDTLPNAMRVVLAGGVFLCPVAQAALDRAERSGDAAGELPGPAILSSREQEVLRYLAHGENTKNIASLLQISPKTVETHRQHITRKLGTNSVAALVHYAIRHGLSRP